MKKIDKNNQNEKIDKSKIIVVSGDGKDLDISKVYDHLNIDEPENDEPSSKKIVIPPVKNNKE